MRLRLSILVAQSHSQRAMFSQLIEEYGLMVHVIRSTVTNNAPSHQVDLEMTGTIAQLQSGLAYLESMNLVIRGRPNTDGDSWYY